MPTMDDILEMRKNTNNAYELFCERLLSHIVGKVDWKTKGSTEMISTIATVSDEAFAILTLESNYSLWKEDVLGVTGGGTKAVSRYTQNGAGTKKYQGWTDEGLRRFNVLAAMVHADRVHDNGVFELMIKEKKMTEENKKTGRRKRRILDDNTHQVECYVEGGEMVEI